MCPGWTGASSPSYFKNNKQWTNRSNQFSLNTWRRRDLAIFTIETWKLLFTPPPPQKKSQATSKSTPCLNGEFLRNYTGCPKKKVQKFKITYLCFENRQITKFYAICQTKPELKFWDLVFKIGQKLTELWVAEDGMKWSTETRAFYL